MEQAQITINVSTQRDGFIFDLRPRSRVWLEAHFPDHERVSSVFIGMDKLHDLQQIPDSIFRHVIQLVIGLSVDELNAIGGFQLLDLTTDTLVNLPFPAYV